ncbi:MAG TPA: polysaccharide deacetylase family protein [Rhizomicrobium sp.]|nr:polysaccharide deacetylase family protein [Rhizomicrobium sp.]
MQEYAAMIKGSTVLREAARYIPSRPLRRYGRPVALFFHGVTERIQDPRIEINHHTVDAFRAIAVQLKRDFDVLPLASIQEVLKRPGRYPRAVFLMSDDGYANTLVAADILEELGLPWTLFVSTEHVETGDFNPLIFARLFIYFAPDGTWLLPHVDSAIVLRSEEDRRKAASWLLDALKRLPVAKARATVLAMKNAIAAERLSELGTIFATERYLSWADVALLARRGVEIGGHAHWHWPMNANQSDEEILLQATLPRAAIEAHVGRCLYFSYPFGNEGDISPAARRAVREAGYTHAFTTLSGTLRGGTDPWLLPRYALKPQETNLSALVPLLRFGDPRVGRITRKLAA